MNSVVEANTYTMIPLDRIVSRLPVRRLSTRGVARIIDSMQRSGFLENYPLIVVPLGDGTYQLIDGNHRYEAAKALGLAMVPCVVKDEMPEGDMYKLALESNSAAETIVPSTLVTYAEFIWQRAKEAHTQEEIAKMMGWSRVKVSQYALLEKIEKQVWNIIATTFDTNVATTEDDDVAKSATTVAFTEGLLRSILDIEPSQQLELVQALANPKEKERITKGKFKTLAESYKARNEMKAHALALLGDLGESFTTQLLDAIYSGAYDADWKNEKHPKLHKLIASIRDEWERKNSIHLVHGDFYEAVKKVGDSSIDLILTDPPYNVASERVFTLEGRSNISQDFGEWDKYSSEEFIALFDVWAAEWARILRDGGSGYVFTSDLYLHDLRKALTKAGLAVHIPIIWHKPNPAPQMITTTFQSTVEYILFFVKGKDYTFHWQGHAGEMHNHINAPVCGGKERLTDAKGDTLHPTQKPEQVIRHFMEISSNRGDTVFDGFMGVGTTGAAAKHMGRKFIGIEQDKMFYDAATRRLAE